MIKAILWDLDGTLLETTELHYISLNKALKEISGFEIDRDWHISTFNGLPTQKKLDILLDHEKIKKEDITEIWNRKQKYTKESIEEVILPDLVKIQMFHYLKGKYKLGVFTNCIYETARGMLEKTGIWNYLEEFISNDMILHPKPNSQGYIKLMVRFEVFPEECVIVEDSPKGITAAKNTGAHVWEVSGCQDVTLINLLRFLEKI